MTHALRPMVMSDKGIVVSGHHLASEAGAAMLREGGNAMDAAISAAAALAVAIPHMNGLGGDAIALYYDANADKVTAINGSGCAPSAATVDRYRALGHKAIPPRGPLSLSVPGVVRAWDDSLRCWGSKPLGACLETAIQLAERGTPIDQAQLDFLTGPVYAELVSEFPRLAEFFGAPSATRELGTRLSQPVLSRTLRTLAEQGAACFYEGPVAKSLLLDLGAAGSLVSERDLAGHATAFADSLAVPYHDRSVHAAPPNSQGIALLLLAGLDEVTASREGAGARSGPALDVAWYMRAKRAAFELRDRHAIDPARGDIPPELLSRASLSHLASSAAGAASEARAGGGDTSTLVVVDSAGNAVSWVQSLFEEFGSGILSERTGVVLHNRLYLEQLNDDPSRGLRPGMRPFHTLCPAMVLGDRGCEMAIATPGDHGQPQTIYQVLRHIYVDGAPVQEAIERPRLRHDRAAEVMVETRAPASWARTLEAEGYSVRDVGPWSRLMGGVNAVHRLMDGVWSAGADPRRSGYAMTGGP